MGGSRAWLFYALGAAVAACAAFGSAGDAANGAGPVAGADASESDVEAGVICGSATELDGGEDANCDGDPRTALDRSDTNCGFCGHRCGGAGCANGTCLPVGVFASSVTIAAVALHAGEVFWAQDDGVVKAGPLDGGVERLVGRIDGTAGNPYVFGLATDATRLYVLSVFGLYTGPFVGGGALTLVQSTTLTNPITVLAVADRTVYWGAAMPNRIFAWDKATGATTAIAAGDVRGLATDGERLFSVERDTVDGGDRFTLLERHPNGDATTLVADLGGPIGPMIVDGTQIYFARWGAIERVTTDGSEPPSVVATWSSTKQAVLGFALDATDLYWSAQNDQDDHLPAIFTAPKCGGRVRTLEAAYLSFTGIAIDDTNLYWATQETVIRIGK